MSESMHQTPKFELGTDETNSPAFFWENPWSGKKEKIASLWWPTHPPELTMWIDNLFENLELKFNPDKTPTPTTSEIVEWENNEITILRAENNRLVKELAAKDRRIAALEKWVSKLKTVADRNIHEEWRQHNKAVNVLRNEFTTNKTTNEQ